MKQLALNLNGNLIKMHFVKYLTPLLRKVTKFVLRNYTSVIPKLRVDVSERSGVHSGVGKRYGNAPKRNCQLMKFFTYLLTL